MAESENEFASTRAAPMISATLADCSIAGILAACGIATAWFGFEHLGPILYTDFSYDVWFQADGPRVFENMISRTSNHYRTDVHPIFSLLLHGPTLLLTALGVPPFAAARSIIVLLGGISAAVFYATLRRLKLPPWPAAVFTSLFVSSAGFLFWFSMIETYPVGAATIVLALYAMASRRTLANDRIAVVLSSLTLSITVTNWMAGLAAVYVRRSWRDFLRISSYALLLVSILAIVQKLIFPSSALFFNPLAPVNELRYTQPAAQVIGRDVWRPLEHLETMISHTVIAPRTTVESQHFRTETRCVLTNQHSFPDLGQPLALLATVAWYATAALGAWGAKRLVRRNPFVLGLTAILVGQFGLHLVYGNVTFLYAAHLLAPLIALAALGVFSPAPELATTLALVAALAGGANNLQRFDEATRLAGQLVSEQCDAPPAHVVQKHAARVP